MTPKKMILQEIFMENNMYLQKCAQCPQILNMNVHIHIMTNTITGEEEVICGHCFRDVEYPQEWVDDELEDKASGKE
jgi:hypothetical protein